MQHGTEGFVEAADGTRLFYEEHGTGSALPVVLCDGIGCDGFVWHYLKPHLAETRRVVHWHYRGHGRSGPPPDPSSMTIEQLARDLHLLLDSLSIERAILIGHSMGTQVALESWHERPARVAGLVLLCGSAGRITETFHGSDALHEIVPIVREAVQKHRGLARAVWGRVPPKLAFRFAKLSGEVDSRTLRSEDFARYWKHVSVMDPDVFLQMLESAGTHSAEEFLGDIEVPTLVMTAENDTFTPPEYVEALAAAVSGSELFSIRGGSHAAPVEQPMIVQLRLDKFLEQREL